MVLECLHVLMRVLYSKQIIFIQSTISQFFQSKHCLACHRVIKVRSKKLCHVCTGDSQSLQAAVGNLNGRIRSLQRKEHILNQVRWLYCWCTVKIHQISIINRFLFFFCIYVKFYLFIFHYHCYP